MSVAVPVPFAVHADLVRLADELAFVLRTMTLLELGGPVVLAQLDMVHAGLLEAQTSAEQLERLVAETPPAVDEAIAMKALEIAAGRVRR